VAVPELTIVPGPDQLNVAPEVVELDERTSDCVVQVNVPPLPGDNCGEVKLLVTDAVAVDVQPLDKSVAVTVYVPFAFTVIVAVPCPNVIPGPDQVKVAPPIDVAVNWRVRLLQFKIVVDGETLAPGAVRFGVTETVLEAVQPVEVLVATTV
jgi:hypothetical protein